MRISAARALRGSVEACPGKTVTRSSSIELSRANGAGSTAGQPLAHSSILQIFSAIYPARKSSLVVLSPRCVLEGSREGGFYGSIYAGGCFRELVWDERAGGIGAYWGRAESSAGEAGR